MPFCYCVERGVLQRDRSRLLGYGPWDALIARWTGGALRKDRGQRNVRSCVGGQRQDEGSLE